MCERARGEDSELSMRIYYLIPGPMDAAPEGQAELDHNGAGLSHLRLAYRTPPKVAWGATLSASGLFHTSPSRV